MKCERCGEKMQHIYTIDYKMTNTKNDYWICNNVDCQHCIKNVFSAFEVTGREKDHVIEARAGMWI